ncbi:MAG: tetraacyldisaccharide 4'-kinase [Deltaproteobacteria bacterium]|nr:tetraacyldisaccharide 4'-kinase [Deltaproteobacteria bacterium]
MFETLRHHVQAIITDAPQQTPWGLGTFLSGASMAYTTVVRARNRVYSSGRKKPKRLPCPVVSVGNLTVGGTGKTPMVMYLAQWAREIGCRPVIISRGYKGKAEKTGGIVSNRHRCLMTAAEAGDEPFMLAHQLPGIPVLVGHNRYASGKRAVASFAPDLIILDDGFQHRQLHRDVNILLLDACRPLGNGRLLPRGPLREPASNIHRADVIVMTRKRPGANPISDLKALTDGIRATDMRRDRPIFCPCHVPYLHHRLFGSTSMQNDTQTDAMALSVLKDRKVFAFSAIANNENFHKTLTEMGCRIAGHANFSDHHHYGITDLQRIITEAERAGAEIIVTTQKDETKIPENYKWPLELMVIGIRPNFGADTETFHRFLGDRLFEPGRKEGTVTP